MVSTKQRFVCLIWFLMVYTLMETVGSSTSETTTAGSSTSVITTAGSSTSEKTTAGSSTSEITTAGSSTSEITTAGSPTSETTTAGSSTSEITTAGSSTSETTTAGSSTSEKTTAGSSTSEINTAGSSTSEITTAGSSTSEKTTAGSSTSEKTTAGSSTSETTTAGSSTSETTTAGSSTSEITTAGSSTSEKTTAGSSTSEITTAGSSTSEITTAGSSTSETTTAGSSTSETTTAGSSTSETTTAGSSTSETTTAGSSTSETTTDGSSTSEITTAGSSSSETTTAGSSTSETTTDGSSTSEITTAGSSTSAITTDGSSSSETTTAGSSTSEITTDGSSTIETSTAGSSTSETTTAGSSTSETTTAGSSTSETTTAGSSSSNTTTAEFSTSDTTTVDSSTSDTTTVDSSTSDTTTVESSTSYMTTVESSTSDITTLESSTSDTATVEASTSDTTTVESSTSDTTTVESSPNDPTTTIGTTTAIPHECTVNSLTNMTQTPPILKENGNATYMCKFHTNNLCLGQNIEWTLNGEIRRNSSRISIIQSEHNGFLTSHLSIETLQKSDKGSLTCKITNNDKIIGSMDINITELPVITLSPAKKAVEREQNITLICNITNYENTDKTLQTFTWCSDGNKLTENTNDNYSSGYSKLLINTTILEVGQVHEYSCDVKINATCPTGHTSQIHVYEAEGTPTCHKNGSWDVSPANFTAILPCPEPQKGYIERLCNSNGVWEEPNTSNCARPEINETWNRLNEDISDPEELKSVVGNAVSKMENVTSDAEDVNFSSSELDQTTNILTKITELVNGSNGIDISKETREGFFRIMDNMLSTENSETWRENAEVEKRTDVSELMKIVENFGDVVARSLDNTTRNIRLDTMTNIVIEIGKTNNNDIHFTANGSSGENDKLNIELKDCDKCTTDQTFIAAVYRTIADALPERQSNISEVLSLSLPGKQSNTLTNPVKLTFNINENDTFECVYWDFDNSSWSSDGCDRTEDVCTCYHLTNFAVLMTTSDASLLASDTYVLRIISYIGCILSSLSTLVTMVVYFKLWRYVKSDRNRLLFNLCAALTIAYLLFLGGINSTHDDVLCTTIAALLHYFFLVTFCLMLAEGIEIFISVTFVFHTKSNLKWFLLLGWGLPAIVVAVTIGITHDEEYNSDLYCWLSFTNGVIYSFIGPVVLIIMVNFVILIIVMKALYSSKLIQTKTEKQKVMAGVRSVSVLLPVLGITWLFGIVSISDDLVVFQYLFALTNSLQGFFIFLFYCVFNMSIRQALERKIRAFDWSKKQSGRSGEENSEAMMKSRDTSHDYYDIKEKISDGTAIKLPRPNLNLAKGTKPVSSAKRFPSFSSIHNHETSM